MWLQVFGNESLTYAMSQRLAFSLGDSELVVSSTLWSSSTVMEGSRLTPVLGGFQVFTGYRNLRTAGNDATNTWMAGDALTALTKWSQNVSLSGNDLGVGLPVGAAAYVSGDGIQAFGFLYLARVAKQEL